MPIVYFAIYREKKIHYFELNNYHLSEINYSLKN